MLALREAQACGYDEALLLDVDGFVAEGSGENIFLVIDGVIHTPALTSALAGITRDTLIAIAEEAGYRIVERQISRDEVYLADEAFFTGTAVEVTPITKIDEKIISNGTVGPITKEIQANYENAVLGTDNNSRNWLTYIE